MRKVKIDVLTVVWFCANMLLVVLASDPPEPDATSLVDPVRELGQRIRQARRSRRLPLRVVAKESNTSVTAVSLLERGLRPMPPQKLAKVVDAVGADPGEIFRLVGAIPPVAVEEMLGSDLARVLQGGGLSPSARSALRREHLGALAAEHATRTDVPPVDIEALLYEAMEIDFAAGDHTRWSFATPGEIHYPREYDDAARSSERRLWLGHMAGHALIARESGLPAVCAAGRLGEADATFLAGLLLMPRDLLRAEFQYIAIPSYDIGTPEGFGGLIADLASRFAVPLWLAARRAGETGLLAWAAGWEET